MDGFTYLGLGVGGKLVQRDSSVPVNELPKLALGLVIAFGFCACLNRGLRNEQAFDSLKVALTVLNHFVVRPLKYAFASLVSFFVWVDVFLNTYSFPDVDLLIFAFSLRI